MDGCDICNGQGPLFTRPVDIDGERRWIPICDRCRKLSDAEIVRRVSLWLPPFDKRLLGVGA